MEFTVDEALKKGIEAHKTGLLQEAERLYTAILQTQPKHPDANHNMGVLAVGVGKIQEALPFFKAAIEANPNIGQFWLSYVDALIKLDRIADAKAVFNQAKNKGAKGEGFDQLEQQLGEQSTKPQDPPSGQLQPIINLYTQGQLRHVLSKISSLLERFPKSFILYNIAGASNARLLQFDAAVDCFKQVLKIKPNDAGAYNNMGLALQDKGDMDAAIDSYKKTIKIKPDYTQAYINMGIALQDKGDMDAAIDSYKKVLKIKPGYAEAYYNMGIALQGKGNIEASIDSYSEAIKIKPDYVNVYNNMGVALKDKGDLEAAIDSYKQAIKIKPDFAEAYYNMGVALNENDDLKGAIDSYKQAIKIKPDYAQVYNNMGNTLMDKGELEAAVDSYEQAIKIKPDFAEAVSNLVSLLTTYTSQKENPSAIVAVSKEIRKINIQHNTSSIISDNEVFNLFSQSLRCISSHGLELRTELSQTYRKNSINLNCKRHKSIFDAHDIIPEFCFGCYKVQIEPRSIIELIKLYFVFDWLELNENNTRKCMIELRPEIPGFYKGLIYCSGLEQANQIAKDLDIVIKQSIGSGLPLQIKRGCSEYAISFPDYKDINNSGTQLMNYNKNWKGIEEGHDVKKSMLATKKIRPSLSNLSLGDFLIIRKWVDYARGIGDPSADLVSQDTVYYQDVYDLAKARLDLPNSSH